MNEQAQNQFIEKFILVLETTKNKEYLIENEIRQIELFTSKEEIPPNFIGELNFANETKSVFNLMEMGNPVLFNSFFNDYLLEGKVKSILEFQEEGEMQPVEDDFLKEERENAIVFAEYYLWLKELKKEPKKTINKISIPHKQKMLILHYLGFVPKYENTKTSELLSLVLELDRDNTRKYMSYMSAGKNEVRTEKNLNAIKNLFETYGITEISNQIQKDIDSMK